MNEIKASVIVPAYNCENTIGKTIEALLSQTVSDIEIIIVDDGSTDNTAEKIKQYENVKYLFEENSGPASARNLGAKNARTDHLFFTDSDCVPEKNWIEEGLRVLTETKVAVVAGTYGIENQNSLLARCIQKEIMYRHNKLMPEYPKVFGSYNFCIRKNVFDEVRGFDEGYRFASGEDNDLSYKVIGAGHKIFFNKKMVVRHKHPELLAKYLKEQYRHGFWRVKMYIEHPVMAKGDDYTFWKDIIEVSLVLCFAFSFVLSFFLPKIFVSLSSLFFVILCTLEIVYGFVIVKTLLESIYMSFVMFCRAFSRMLGFSSGIFAFLPKKSLKKTNKSCGTYQI